jgi:hypothetical protein
MKQKYSAVVLSPDNNVLQTIRSSFETLPDVELTFHTDISKVNGELKKANVLILHGDSRSTWLREIRGQGYTQPALVLSGDSLCAEPQDSELRPFENVTLGVIHAGGLPSCINMLVNSAAV